MKSLDLEKKINHDLWGSYKNIRSFCELIKEDYPEDENQSLYEYLHFIEKSLDRMQDSITLYQKNFL